MVKNEFAFLSDISLILIHSLEQQRENMGAQKSIPNPLMHCDIVLYSITQGLLLHAIISGGKAWPSAHRGGPPVAEEVHWRSRADPKRSVVHVCIVCIYTDVYTYLHIMICNTI